MLLSKLVHKMQKRTRWSVAAAAAKSTEDNEKEDDTEDPHELVSRFIWTHDSHFEEALAELKRGRKCSCWMWYIFPTPPWIVNGIERGSWTNCRYALRTDEQAQAYLKLTHSGVNLRKNYLEASEAIVFHLDNGKSLRSIVGIADEPKLISSWEYFEKMTREEEDQGLHNVIVRGLELIRSPETSKKRREAERAATAPPLPPSSAPSDPPSSSAATTSPLSPSSSSSSSDPSPFGDPSSAPSSLSSPPLSALAAPALAPSGVDDLWNT